jgi:hypothetical protein
MQNLILTLSILLSTSHLWASMHQVPKARVSCPVPTKVASYDRSAYPEILLVTSGVLASHINQFLFEYEKIPGPLRSEMREIGGRTHLISGTGVTADPTWDRALSLTRDGRGWDNVVGSSGFPYLQYPTRVVVNRLYEGHGSVNVVLHEHGHSLDSNYETRGISNTSEWQELISDAPVKNLLHALCGTYCSENAVEAFAELFAYYHACDKSRNYLEEKAPAAANFFRNFQSAAAFTGARSIHH